MKVNNPQYATFMENTANLNLTTEGIVKYQDTRLTLFHVLRYKGNPNMTQDDFKRFV